MKASSALLAILAVCCFAQPGRAAPGDVLPSAKRVSTMELAARLARPASEGTMTVPGDLRNPFNPAAAVKTEAHVGCPATDEDLLAVLADQLHATGMVTVGDTPILLLGQKKVKLNERITLSFDGVSYDVELIGIDRNTFSLRLNKAEVTRPIIKTGKN